MGATVEPIRNPEKIYAMLDWLQKNATDRDVLIMKIGLNTILRISDILALKVSDVWYRGKVKDEIRVEEKKTVKNKVIAINETLANHLTLYIKKYELEDSDYLCFNYHRPDKPISRQMAWYILKKASYFSGVENFGTHSLRKTLAYHIYKDTKDIALVMRMLNHSNPEYTLRYIGVSGDEIKNTYLKYMF